VSSYSERESLIKAAIAEIGQPPSELGKFLDAVRRHSGKPFEEWPDGYIHQAAIDLGLDVEI